MIRAYNDWHIHEWCGAYPGRFIPLGLSGFMLGADWMAERDPPPGRPGVSRGVVPRRDLPLRHARLPRRRVGPGVAGLPGDRARVMVFHFGGDAQLHAAHAVRRDPALDAVPDGDLRRRSCCGRRSCASSRRVKLALAEGGIGWVPVLPREGRLRLRPPPPVDRRQDFGDKLPEPGVPRARADVLHRRRHRAAQPRVDRRRHDHVGVRLPPLRLDVAELARGADEDRSSAPNCPTRTSTRSRGRTPPAGTSSTRSSTAPVRSAPWGRCGRRPPTSTPRRGSTGSSSTRTASCRTRPSSCAARPPRSGATTTTQ